MAFLPIVTISIDCRSSFVRHEASGSCNSRTVWPRINKFYTDIRTYQVCGHTEYHVASCFWSAANWISMLAIIAKSCLKRCRSNSVVCKRLNNFTFWIFLGKTSQWCQGQWKFFGSSQHTIEMFVVQCQMQLQLSHIFKLNDTAFCLAPPFGGFLDGFTFIFKCRAISTSIFAPIMVLSGW